MPRQSAAFTSLLGFNAESSNARTYALRRPKLAEECSRQAIRYAQEAKRPDLAYEEHIFLAALLGYRK